MLRLPNNITMERDAAEETRLHTQAKKYLETKARTPGIHVSDLLDPRIAYFRKRDKLGVEDRLVNVFLIGELAHAVIEVVKGATDGGSDAGTQLVDGISFSPDFIHPDGVPDEVKTTRSFYLPKAPYLPNDSTYHMYLEQLLSYMALMGKTEGKLTILYLNLRDAENKTAPQFFIWKVKITQDELEIYKAQLGWMRDRLENAIENQNPSTLPLCRGWKCRDCQWFATDCKPPGRYEFGQTKEKLWTQ